jgi:signal transduction histidine kinase
VIAQYGLFGMPIFLIFLSYMVVKFQTFNIKVVGAQILVAALVFLVFAILFIRKIENVRIVVIFTLAAVGILGYSLVRSVKKEVEQREEIATLAEDVKRAYVIEKRAKEEIERLDKFKDQFLMTTQHNLRTPLTSMMGYSDLLLKGVFGKQNKKTIEVIGKFQTLTQGMIKMVNDFLNMAQFQLGRDVLAFKPGIDLSPILQEIMTELEFKAKTKKIYLKMEKPETLPTINADREKLKAALFNVIDNAVKYTVKGGVSVAVENNATSIKIVVSDTGIGIPKEEMKNLFDSMFSRGEQAKRLDTVGSGVGLYLSAQIVKAHKGRVWVESGSEGSTFYIELPVTV